MRNATQNYRCTECGTTIKFGYTAVWQDQKPFCTDDCRDKHFRHKPEVSIAIHRASKFM